MSRAEGSNTFEIATSGKMYYLTADSQPIVEEWVRVLQNVVQRNALRLLLSRQDQAPTLSPCDAVDQPVTQSSSKTIVQ